MALRITLISENCENKFHFKFNKLSVVIIDLLELVLRINKLLHHYSCDDVDVDATTCLRLSLFQLNIFTQLGHVLCFRFIVLELIYNFLK